VGAVVTGTVWAPRTHDCTVTCYCSVICCPGFCHMRVTYHPCTATTTPQPLAARKHHKSMLHTNKIDNTSTPNGRIVGLVHVPVYFRNKLVSTVLNFQFCYPLMLTYTVQYTVLFSGMRHIERALRMLVLCVSSMRRRRIVCALHSFMLVPATTTANVAMAACSNQPSKYSSSVQVVHNTNICCSQAQDT
jgi:hypothetical protein